MTYDVAKWVKEKIKAGYSSESIELTLIKNGFSAENAVNIIKESKMKEIRRYIPEMQANKKQYTYIFPAVVAAVLIIAGIAILFTFLAGNDRCGHLAMGDARYYCDAIYSEKDIIHAIDICTHISDEKLAAVCIERQFAKGEDKADKDACSQLYGDLKYMCYATVERKNAYILKKGISDDFCKDISDEDIKVWCFAKNLENSVLSESILECSAINDIDYRFLCRADKYKKVAKEEEKKMCEFIDDDLYRFVCIN